MPESPEVQILAEFLAERISGREIAGTDLVEFRALKTRDRPLTSIVGERVRGVRRCGKHLAVELSSGYLVISLGRHGWARWSDEHVDAPADAPPALAVVTFDDSGEIAWTDAGDWVSLGVFVVDDPLDVPAVAGLGPDPAHESFTRAHFDAVTRGRRKQIKAVLQEQSSLAGIGNAYSDEILHAARTSPVALAAALDDDALDRVFDAMLLTVRGSIAARRGIPIAELKAAKVAAMRVHGRTGEPCPVCGDDVRDVRFAGTTAQYCPTCQTGGALL